MATFSEIVATLTNCERLSSVVSLRSGVSECGMDSVRGFANWGGSNRLTARIDTF